MSTSDAIVPPGAQCKYAHAAPHINVNINMSISIRQYQNVNINTSISIRQCKYVNMSIAIHSRGMQNLLQIAGGSQPDQQQAVFPDGAVALSCSRLLHATLAHAMHLIKDDISQALHPLPVLRCGGEEEDLQAGRYCDQDTRIFRIVPVVTCEGTHYGTKICHDL